MSDQGHAGRDQQALPNGTDPVELHMSLERQFLARQLATLLTGSVLVKDDPEEERIGDEMERIWLDFTPEELRRARRAAEQRSAAWHDPRSHLVDDSPPGGMGDPYTIWVRALPNALEVCLPHSTQARLGHCLARTARAVIAWDRLASIPGATRTVLIDTALMLLGRTRSGVRTDGGLRFLDPEARSELFAVDVVPSGVAETADPPHE